MSSSSSSSKSQLCCYKNRATRLFSIPNMAQKSQSSKICRNGHKPNNKDKKNPYSNRGLDKFSALLTDLEEKRNKIYSKTDPKNIVLVRFAYKNSNECVPVVVKKPVAESEPVKGPNQTDRRVRNLRRLNKPSYYVAATVVLILFLLSVFGRSATILGTCVFWYLVPVLKQSSSKSRTFTKRNDFSRILQPVGSFGFCSPIRAHRKSW